VRARLADGGLFSLGGVWNRVADGQGRDMMVCTVLLLPGTHEQDVHVMPAIVPARCHRQWLDPRVDPGTALDAVRSFERSDLHVYPRPRD
jgi:putative SOS response-associated peptidase YedK